MNDQNAYGFNPEAINRTISNIKTRFNELDKNLGDGISRVFSKLADNWFAPEAIDFYDHAREKIFTVYRIDIVGNYSGFMNLFQASCNKWAETVGSDFRVSLNLQDEPARSIPYTDFKASNSNGFVGVYEQNISDINRDFDSALNQLSEDITKMVQAIKTDPSLYGAAQLDAFENCVKNWQGKVARIFTEIFNEMTTKINQTREKYQSTAQANAQRFASGN